MAVVAVVAPLRTETEPQELQEAEEQDFYMLAAQGWPVAEQIVHTDGPAVVVVAQEMQQQVLLPETEQESAGQAV